MSTKIRNSPQNRNILLYFSRKRNKIIIIFKGTKEWNKKKCDRSWFVINQELFLCCELLLLLLYILANTSDFIQSAKNLWKKVFAQRMNYGIKEGSSTAEKNLYKSKNGKEWKNVMEFYKIKWIKSFFCVF